MSNLFRSAFCFLLIFCVAAPSAFARAVYLKDGSVIENVRSVWRERGNVQVLVNRDVLLTLSKDEVNLDKTFKSAAKRGGHPKVRKAAATVKPASGSVEASPVVANASPQKVGVPAESGAVKTPTAAAQPTLKEAQPGAKTAAPADTAKPAPAPVTTAASQPPANQSPEAVKKALQEAAVQAMMQDGGKAAAASATSALLMIGGMVFVMMLIFWKVYVKAGEAGWKGLIPIYNVIVLLRIAGRPAWWLLLFLVPLVNLVFVTIMHIDIAKRFGKETWFGFGLTFASPVFFAILAFDNSTYHEI